MEYKLVTSEKILIPEGRTILDYGVTRIGIDDESDGPYIVIKQQTPDGDMEVGFDAKEWLYIVAAAAEILKSIDRIET